jgi:SAM-dependent methyltransferase
MQRLQPILDGFTLGRHNIEVLEAGCGSATHVRLPKHFRVTGIDISAAQLDRNETLHVKVLGDIQTHPLATNRYDLVICWNVMEHLRKPLLALQNMAQATRRGGTIVLALPNVMSVEGLLTKITPHWFHVWYYRHVLGNPCAGRNGVGPFPTPMRLSISPRGLLKWARAMGLRVDYMSVYDGGRLKERPTLRALFTTLAWTIQVMSFGLIRATEGSVLAVLRKEA